MQELETEEDKTMLALGLFSKEKTLNPNLSDRQIVEKINKRILENKKSTQDSSFVKKIGIKM